MKKTGSELTSEIVGPAGSTRKVGAFSCWIVEEDEEEFWCEPEELLGEDCVRPGFGESATPKQIRSAAGTEYERRNGNGINESLSASLVRRADRVKREVPTGNYPRTDTPEKESTARPRTGWPKKRAGSKRLNNSIFSTCARVAASSGPETMR